MYKILLDERFYQGSVEQIKYLERLLNVIKKYFHAEIAYFTPFGKSEHSYTRATFGQLIHKQLLQTRQARKYDAMQPGLYDDDYLEGLGFSREFVGRVQYLLESDIGTKVIIPFIYSTSHRKLEQKCYQARIFFIGNFDEEVNSNIADWIISDNLVHVDANAAGIFPATELCCGYNTWRSEILKGSANREKEAKFTEIAAEVAKRNKYLPDARLTKLNKLKAGRDSHGNYPKRQVFSNSNYYLSTDFENGGFEVFTKNTKYLGQYKFDGLFEKQSDEVSHRLFLN